MALDLTDCQFTGPALPEPFVRFELEKELTKHRLLPKTTGSDGRQLKADWSAYRRHLAQLAVRGGPVRVRNHAIEPIVARLGYAELKQQDLVETREGRESGGHLLLSADHAARLRVWVTSMNEDLDAPAKRGRAYRFSHLRIAQRVLLACGERVGVLTNGVELRLLISDPARPDSQVIVPIDPGWKRSRDVPDSFRLLLALASPAGVKAVPDLVDKARLQQARVTKDLRDQARKAIERFIQEVFDHPDNRAWLDQQQDRSALACDLWHEGLVLVYRLLFILKLESSDDPARSFSFASTSLWRNTFSPSMALARFAHPVLDKVVETGGLLEAGLRTLFKMFDEGVECTELNVKPLGGALFGATAAPMLSQLRWGERAVAHLLDQLLWTTPKRKKGARERVHYGPLDVEDLGRVYEALLELEPGITSEPMCRLRRQKLEVVVPIAQGEKYRPKSPLPPGEGQGEGGPNDEDAPEVDEDEEETPKRGKKTTVHWIEEIPPGRFYLRVGLGRKASGSYYTPHSFVRFLVQETLGPQVAERSPPDDPRPGEILKLKVLDPAMGSGHFLVEACRFLGSHLYEAARLCDEKALDAERRAGSAGVSPADKEAAETAALQYRKRILDLPDPEDELLRYLPSRAPEGEQPGISQPKAEALCRRMVAVHCLYGVDKNPLAVELAKLALWLESHAEGMPLTFLDHRLVVGDSLTGPFWDKLIMRPSNPKEPVEGVFHQGLTLALQNKLAEALSLVRHLEATVGVSLSEIEEKRRLKAELDQALRPFRIIAAAWSGGVMLGPEKCDDLAYADLLKSVAETGEIPERIESDRLQAMVARGLGLDWSAGVPPAFLISGQTPPREENAAVTAALQPKGWHYRGYLPHFDGGDEAIQFVTFRLADSFPASRLDAWKRQLKLLPPAKANAEVRRRMEEYLDAGHGECLLRDPRIAALVQDALLFFHDERYDLHAWVVMPNHVHVLFRPRAGHSLSDIVQSWKSYTAKQANRILGRTGQFWQEDYFDRYIRDEDHYLAEIAYIEENPVSAGLCKRKEEWPFGSAGRSAARSAGILPASSSPASSSSVKDTQTARNAGGTPALRRDTLYALLTSSRCAPALPYDFAFPEVFYPTGVPHGRRGFDAVLGNPPWDAVRPKAKEFFAGFDFEILAAPTKRERTAIEKRLKEDPHVAALHREYEETIDRQQRAHQALYQHQVVYVAGEKTGGDPDLAKLFLERCPSLLRQQGFVGLVVPSAFHANEGATGVRRLYMERLGLRCCYSFENRRQLFEIHRSFKFATVVAQAAPRSAGILPVKEEAAGSAGILPVKEEAAGTAALQDAISCAFYLHDDEWLFGDREGREPLSYTLDFIRRTGGEYLSLLELRTRKDLEVAEVCFANGEPFGQVCQRLGIRLGRELHMTDDAWRFTPTGDVLPAGEDPRDPSVAARLLEMGYLVLHEGKTFWHYDDHWEQRPRYLVSLKKLHDKRAWCQSARYYRLAFRDIASSTNERTGVFCLCCPGIIFGNKAPCDREAAGRPNSASLSLLATVDSFAFDFLVRQRVQATLNFFILDGTPFPTMRKWRSLAAHCALRLTCNHSGYEPLWREQVGDAWREPGKLAPGARASRPQDAAETTGSAGILPASSEAGETPALRPTWPVLAGDDERWEVRAAIDAVVADAYGLSRDQYEHVLSTFSHKSYPKAPELCLARFEELKKLGLAAFTRKHDPYHDIPLNENLPEPVIDLPIPEDTKKEEQSKLF